MHGGIGVLLLSAIGGYWVLERAEKHKKPLKSIGQMLGGAIIVISLVSVACTVWCGGKSCGWKGRGAKTQCPFSRGSHRMPAPDTVPSDAAPALDQSPQ